MKLINFNFLLFVLFLFSSCEKEIIDKRVDIAPEDTSINDIENIDGILHFKSENAFMAVMKIQSTQTEEQKNEFVNSLNFISYSSVAHEAYSYLNNAKDETEFSELLKRYSDVLYIDGENVEQVVNDPFYSRICNRNGFFFIKEKAFKVTKNGLYSSDNGNITDLEMAAKSRNTQIDGVLFTGKSEPVNLKSLQISAVPSVDQEKTNSDGNRKIRFIVSTTFYYHPVEGQSYNVGHYVISCQTRTYWRRFWYFTAYNNPHYISDFRVEVKSPSTNGSLFQYSDYYPFYSPAFTNNYNGISSATTYPEEYTEVNWKQNEQVGGDIFFYSSYSPAIVVPALIKYLKIKVWSRGMGENQALIFTQSYD
jgi:hypothetical protein